MDLCLSGKEPEPTDVHGKTQNLGGLPTTPEKRDEETRTGSGEPMSTEPFLDLVDTALSSVPMTTVRPYQNLVSVVPLRLVPLAPTRPRTYRRKCSQNSSDHGERSVSRHSPSHEVRVTTPESEVVRPHRALVLRVDTGRRPKNDLRAVGVSHKRSRTDLFVFTKLSFVKLRRSCNPV